MEKVVIIGTGAAGLTAAIYTARANLSPLVIDGMQPGGQLTTTTDVENFPGFPEGIMGPELMQRSKAQAERFGAELRTVDVTRVQLAPGNQRVWVEEEEFRSPVVIVSTGARANLMGLDSEKRLMGRGVSACATCDGFFFKDRVVAVVGGGDSAAEEALYLAKLCKKVYIAHRRDELRASKILQQRIFDDCNIEMLWNTVLTDIKAGPDGVEFALVELAGGVYRGIDQPVPTIGVWNVMICQASLDTDMVYKLAKALFENNDYLKKIHPSAAYTTPENAVKYSPIPLHPGTIKYLEEKGITVPDKLRP